ncbi:MAG: outer membrane lipid asymmetry maintenance protein MlaD [Mariprofundaceae bacterium]
MALDKKVEIGVGLFVFIGILGMAYLTLKLGEVGGLGESGYSLQASFDDIGGLRTGADVMIAGVSVGRVQGVALSDEDEALLDIHINEGVHITEDAIASVRTKGIIGDRYVRISQGGDDEFLKDGDRIVETESILNIEDLIAKFIYSGSDSSK